MWRPKSFFQKCRQGILGLLEKIPRKMQVLINLIFITIFLFQGCPCFTPEQAYRRLEKANAVGPAQILGYENADGLYATNIVVAQTQYGVILSQIYPQNKISYAATSFFYVEKQGDITVTPAPRDLYWQMDREQQCLTILVFDEYPQTVRAELEFSVYWDGGEGFERYENTYKLESHRINDEYFRFDLPFTYNKYEVDPQANAIFQLSQIFYFPTDWTPPAEAYPVTVRLYDENDQLIVEKFMHLFEQITK